MEAYYSSINFHLYLMDFDGDGRLDLVYPCQVTNAVTLLLNPGGGYWSKVQGLKDKYGYQSKERLQQEVNGKGVEKWRAVPLVESAYSISVRDFLFVNIDG